MAKVLTKSQIIQAIADAHEDKLPREDVSGVLASLRRSDTRSSRRTACSFSPASPSSSSSRSPPPRSAGHQPVHQGADRLQGQAGSQGFEGAPREGRQRRPVGTTSPTSPRSAGRVWVAWSPPLVIVAGGRIRALRFLRSSDLPTRWSGSIASTRKPATAADTRLVGGQKVRKHSPRIEAFGTIDETSACIGLARTALLAPSAPIGADVLATVLRRVQNELFNLGSDLATLPADRHPKQPLIEARHVSALESEIDGWNALLPELRSFILPGGGVVAAYLHLARTVCRRAERLIVHLAETEEIGDAGAPLRQQALGRAVRDEPPRLSPLRRARAPVGARDDLE